jgi:O-antigen/teichoic acid export membrane protein
VTLRSIGRHALPSPTAHLVEQSFVLTVSTGMSAAGGFIAWSIAAHAASAQDVGLAAGLFSSCSLLSYLTSLALPYGLLRYAATGPVRRILATAIALTAVTSILGAAIFAAGTRLWAPSLTPELTRPYALLAYIGLNVAVSVSVLVDAYFIGKRRAGLVCFRNALVAAGKIIGLTLVGLSGQATASRIFLAMLMPVAISILFVSAPLYVAFTQHDTLTGRAKAKEFLQFSLKNYAAALLDGAPTFLLPVIVLRLAGATANAYFYVAWSIASVIGLIAAAVGQVTLREIGATDDRCAVVKKAQIMSLTATGLAATVFAVAAPLVLHAFGQTYSYQAVLPLRLLLLSSIPGAYLTISIAIMRGEKRYAAVTKASMAYALFTIGCTVAIGRGGLDSACVGWVVGITVATAAVAVIGAQRQSSQDLPHASVAAHRPAA